MNKDLTDITLVVDRSGSMQQRREDAQGGVNAFVQQQAREPGDALLTLVQFDTEYEIVHSGVPVQDVPEYELVPRGLTALLDAVGRAINETGKRLSDMNEADRPGLVIFVITTDGLENSSQEFTRDQIKEMRRPEVWESEPPQLPSTPWTRWRRPTRARPARSPGCGTRKGGERRSWTSSPTRRGRR
jgi:hypothetical protein